MAEAPDHTLLFHRRRRALQHADSRDPQPLPGPVDLVITESTYGNATHGAMEQIEPQLLDAVNSSSSAGAG